MKIFGLTTSRESALGLAGRLGLALAEHEEREFEDGEFKVRPIETVRGERVIIYQSLAGDSSMSANDRLLRALVFAGAVRDAGAAEVVLLAPYLAYARKDRRTQPRDPVTTRYLAQMIESVGIDEVIALDVHNPAAFENAFRCRTRDLGAAPLFVEHFRALAAAAERFVVVSPDAGGIGRARRLAACLADKAGRPVDLAFVEKHRSGGVVAGGLFAGDVRDATVLIVDDMISGGTTMRRAAALCLERGARTVHAAATHGIFSPGAAETCGAGLIESVVVTDSVPDVDRRGRAFGPRLTVLGIAGLLATAVG